MEAKISKHNCISEQQDKIHGAGNRVFNPAFSKGSKPKRYRCTVCGVEKEL